MDMKLRVVVIEVEEMVAHQDLQANNHLEVFQLVAQMENCTLALDQVLQPEVGVNQKQQCQDQLQKQMMIHYQEKHIQKQPRN